MSSDEEAGSSGQTRSQLQMLRNAILGLEDQNQDCKLCPGLPSGFFSDANLARLPEKDRSLLMEFAESLPSSSDSRDKVPAAQESSRSELPRSGRCPLNYEELGNTGWAYLHTMAAYYPPKASKAEQVHMKEFLERFAEFYPCGSCGEHMLQDMDRNPPDLKGQSSFSLWMCHMHNRVNQRLGKSIFDCSKVDERWKDGPADGSCD